MGGLISHCTGARGIAGGYNLNSPRFHALPRQVEPCNGPPASADYRTELRSLGSPHLLKRRHRLAQEQSAGISAITYAASLAHRPAAAKPGAVGSLRRTTCYQHCCSHLAATTLKWRADHRPPQTCCSRAAGCAVLWSPRQRAAGAPVSWDNAAAGAQDVQALIRQQARSGRTGHQAPAEAAGK